MNISGNEHKNKSTTGDIVAAINDINNTLGKSISKDSGIFKKIKELWFIIPLMIFIYAVYMYIPIYYLHLFNYKMSPTIEYIQEQISNGFYKWIIYSIIIVSIRLVSYGFPLLALSSINSKCIRIILIVFYFPYVYFMEMNAVFNLTSIFIIPDDEKLKDNGELWGLWEIIKDDPCVYILWLVFSIVIPFVMFIIRLCVDDADVRRNICISKFSLVSLVVIFIVLPWIGPSYTPNFLNGGRSVSCISGNNGEEPVDALPYKYESRGVYVFRGEIKTNDEGKQYLRNVNREFLLFEKGYKVTSGVCESGSSSVHPPQGQ